MARPLDQFTHDWVDAQVHRLRTARQPSKTVREAQAERARGYAVAWSTLALVLLAVAGAYLVLHCGWEPLGC